MIGKYIQMVGDALMFVVGPVHDALRSDDMDPVLSSEAIELAPLSDTPVMPGTINRTIAYYVGGTTLVVALVCVVLNLLKKPAKRATRKARTKAVKRTKAAASRARKRVANSKAGRRAAAIRRKYSKR